MKSIKHDKYYIGSSGDPQRRLKFHNAIEKGFTSRYKPWKIVWVKGFKSKSEALKAEKKIKRWKSRKMLEELIKGEIHL